MYRILFAAILTSITLAACNTMEGVGQDIEKGGQNIQRSAEDHK